VEIRAIEERRAERQRLLGVAREYVKRLARRVDLVSAAVTGSVARGDFNVWSDIDVVVVAVDLPPRAPDRAALLLEGAPPRVQPVGYTPAELRHALARGNALVREAVDHGFLLHGETLVPSG
jgi:predicted nucleotidyltransferase